MFDVGISREIVLLGAEGIAGAIGVPLPGTVNAVGFESRNAITNTGEEAWTRKSGLLSIWIPGMFRPGARTTVVIPFREGPEERLGPVVNDAYFGQIPAERLVLSSDCGMGREGMSRRHAYNKMVSIVRGANIVRGELGLPLAESLATNDEYSLVENG